MKTETFDSLLKKRILEKKELFENNVSSGKAEDYPAYKHACGVILGLSFALDELNDLLNMLGNEDDIE